MNPDETQAPPGSMTIALRLFLGALTMFFGAGLVMYVAVRTGSLGEFGGAAEAADIGLPVVFWYSTFVILVSSVVLQGAVIWSRAGREEGARRFLVLSMALGYAFLIMQIPGSYRLLAEHRAASESGLFLYGLVLVLVVLHALHLVGGLIPMTSVTVRALGASAGMDAGRVRHVATYWHFLAIVWLVMFNVFLLVG